MTCPLFLLLTLSLLNIATVVVGCDSMRLVYTLLTTEADPLFDHFYLFQCLTNLSFG